MSTIYERVAAVKAGVSGYLGHLSEAERKQRMAMFNKLMDDYGKEGYERILKN